MDIDYSPEGALVAVAQSKMDTPEIIYNRILSCAEKDERGHQKGRLLKVGLSGWPFSVCLHLNMSTELENTKAVRKAVDEVNKKLCFK